MKAVVLLIPLFFYYFWSVINQLSDKAWIQGFQEKKAENFRHLYNIYARQLYMFVERIVRDRPAAEDIVTESFLKLYERAANFETASAIKSFLFTVARNAALDHVKINTARQQHHQQLGYQEPPYLHDPEQEYIIAEAVRLIHLEIDKLPAQCREVIQRSLLEGQTSGEIAAEMNLAIKTVQNYKIRGMQQLRMTLLNNKLLPALVLLENGCLFWLLEKSV